MWPSAISAARSARVATSRSWVSVFSSCDPKTATGAPSADTSNLFRRDAVVAELPVQRALADVENLRRFPSVAAGFSQRVFDRRALDLGLCHPWRQRHGA